LNSKLIPRVKSKDERNHPYHDDLGYYRTTVIEKKGAGAYKRESMMFPILGHTPRPGKRWQIGEDKARELEKNNRFLFDGEKILLKIYSFEEKDTTSAQPNLLLDHGTTDASARLVNNEILQRPETFSNPKPIELVSHFLSIGGESSATILDFFAGSGTTLHATMQLNAEDGGNRKCILVTNNENGICENVTYERNKRVINGYTKPNGDEVEGLTDNNLRYYRTSFVGRSRATKNMRQLMSLATDMLCIKEDLYIEQKQFGELPTHPKVMRCFAKGDKSMLVIYYEEAIPEIVEQIEKLSPSEPIKVYVFSPSEDPWEEDFEFVSDKVELCALPAAIYNTYKRILPKKKDERVDIDVNAKEPEQPKGEATLFDLFEEGGEQ
jgi:adenine-specific DNA-methyltransferase